MNEAVKSEALQCFVNRLGDIYNVGDRLLSSLDESIVKFCFFDFQSQNNNRSPTIPAKVDF